MRERRLARLPRQLDRREEPLDVGTLLGRRWQVAVGQAHLVRRLEARLVGGPQRRLDQVRVADLAEPGLARRRGHGVGHSGVAEVHTERRQPRAERRVAVERMRKRSRRQVRRQVRPARVLHEAGGDAAADVEVVEPAVAVEEVGLDPGPVRRIRRHPAERAGHGHRRRRLGGQPIGANLAGPAAPAEGELHEAPVQQHEVEDRPRQAALRAARRDTSGTATGAATCASSTRCRRR